MYKLLLFILLTFTAFLSCSPKRNAGRGENPSGKFENSIRVMTYNVHHCNPPSKEAQGSIELDTIVGVIRQQHPDLVALQEIDDHTARSGSFNQAEEIARKLNMHFYFSKAIDYGGGGYGVAILSRFPLSDTSTVSLPSAPGFVGEVRVLSMAKITFPNGKTIRFASTHLEVKSRENRELQVAEILRVAALDKIPFVIGGDFNDPIGSNTINTLDGLFQRTCTTCDFTIPVNKPNKTIDHIAFTKSYPFRVLNHQVIPERYASDHLPVIATLKFND